MSDSIGGCLPRDVDEAIQEARISLLLKWGIFLWAMIYFGSCTSNVALSREGNPPPNIVIILADDMGYSDLGCMGSEIMTPNIDRLAKDGLIFTHCYNASRCCPSRASLLTGLYQHAAGIGYMSGNSGVPSYQGFLNDKCLTIAEALSSQGYTTSMSGKWHVGGARTKWPDHRGFDRFYGLPSGGGVYFYPSKFRDRPLYKNGVKVTVDTSTFYSTDDFTSEAMELIKESNALQKPFFLYLAYVAPHFPLQAWPEDIAKYHGKYNGGYTEIRQQRFENQKALGVVSDDVVLSAADFADWSTVDTLAEAYKMAVYAAQVDRLDQNIGRIIDQLDAMGQLDNTLIMFLSDNGASGEAINETPEGRVGTRNCFESYGKNWANVSNTPYRKYKMFEHEGGIITPLIVHWPVGIEESGRLISDPIHIVDLMPTSLDVAGMVFPSHHDGRALLPLDGRSFTPHLDPGMSLPDLPLYWEHMGNRAVRSGDFKLVKVHERDWELYDLKSDPVESEDISNAYPILRDSLLSLWNAWAQIKGVEAWPINHKDHE